LRPTCEACTSTVCCRCALHLNAHAGGHGLTLAAHARAMHTHVASMAAAWCTVSVPGCEALLRGRAVSHACNHRGCVAVSVAACRARWRASWDSALASRSRRCGGTWRLQALRCLRTFSLASITPGRGARTISRGAHTPDCPSRAARTLLTAPLCADPGCHSDALAAQHVA
jgi:hypothetical protein